MKHKEIIKAWLDGETVEYLCPFVERWKILDQHSSHSSMPSFADNREYRIKPKVGYSYVVVRKDETTKCPSPMQYCFEEDKSIAWYEALEDSILLLKIGTDGSVEVLRKKEGI